jgi:hypothetical protein
MQKKVYNWENSTDFFRYLLVPEMFLYWRSVSRPNFHGVLRSYLLRRHEFSHTLLVFQSIYCRKNISTRMEHHVSNSLDTSHVKTSITGYSIYLCSCCLHLEHRESVKCFVSLQFLNFRQLVGLLGRGISPSQSHYLHQNNINTE